MGGDHGWSGGDRLQHHGRSDRTGYSPDHLRRDSSWTIFNLAEKSMYINS